MSNRIMNRAVRDRTTNKLIHEILCSGRVLVLSGAGLSTDSGIPDYRGPETRKRKTAPIQHQDFVASPEVRRRYWARSSLGWPTVRDAEPNSGHHFLAELAGKGLVTGVITQNVDGLHQAAGSTQVLELHGSLYDVRCLSCEGHESREAVQQRILRLNPGWPGVLEGRSRESSGHATVQGQAHGGGGETVRERAPDGDVELPQELEASFRVPSCTRCDGILKPDVVFFGDSVPKDRVKQAWRLLEESASVLVIGSSLTVFSGYRFVREAAKQGKPIIIINNGATRGDVHATVKIDQRIGDVLPLLSPLIRC
jgi:NAD-dependent SIR2 family protein deacetylase